MEQTSYKSKLNLSYILNFVQKIVFLPALPDEWKDGMAEGVKAPGNITLNFKWKEKRVTEINLKSPIDAKLVILYNGMEEEIVLNAGSSYQKTLI